MIYELVRASSQKTYLTFNGTHDLLSFTGYTGKPTIRRRPLSWRALSIFLTNSLGDLAISADLESEREEE